jgi:diguanylate cyclase (GGDEF)-like protein/PAS domain S-box-containing protein
MTIHAKQPGPAPRQRKPLSVRVRLYSLALLIALPACAYVAHSIVTEYRSQFREAERGMLSLAQITAADTQNFLDDTHLMLTRFSQRTAIREAERGKCDLIFFQAFSGVQARFSNLGLANRAGTLLCTSTPIAEGKTISVANRRWFKAVEAGSEFAVGSLMVDQVTGDKAVAFGVPVRDADGALSGALGISLSLARYKPVTHAAQLPPGSLIAIVDGEGIVLSSSSDAQRIAGMAAGNFPVVQAVLAQKQGIVRGVALDRVERIYGFSSVENADWYALAGIPVETVLDAARGDALRHTGFGLATIGVLAFLAWYLARSIGRPVRAIAQVAREVAAGRLATRIAIHGPAEIEDVARALNDMLDVRTSAEAALTESEARRAAILESAKDAIITVGKDQRIVLFNRAAEEIFGCAAAQAVGAPLEKFIPQRFRGAHRRHVTDFGESGKSARDMGALGTIYGLRADGEEFPIEASISRIRIGPDILLTVILRDVTERARIQAELAHLTSTLEQRVRARTVELELANQRLKENSTEVGALNDLSERLHTCASTEEAITVASHFMRSMFDAGSGGIFLLKASHDLVEGVSVWGNIASAEQVFSPEACCALRRGKTFVYTGEDTGLACQHLPQTDHAYLCVPMMAQSETVGIIHIREARRENMPLDAQVRITEAVAERAGLAIANLNLREALRQQSIHDPLTGLYNRRFLEESLNRELARCKRKGATFAVLMIDVDHFKRFNDTYGHDAGDEALCAISAALRESTREADVVCRFGGEEFLVLLPDTDLAGATALAKRIVECIRRMEITHNGKTLPSITASLGLAMYPQNGETVKSLIQSADMALYAAKGAGRDRIVVAA